LVFNKLALLVDPSDAICGNLREPEFSVAIGRDPGRFGG
jgi:hypothetical protein